jgi:hypothetical protein
MTKVAGLVSLTVALAAVATAQNTVGPSTISPPSATAGVPTQVTVTAQILSPALIVSSVNLQALSSTGQVTSVVGTLVDNGTAGDAVANDRIFTIRFTLNQAAAGTAVYRVSAAFSGQLTRSYSSLLNVAVNPAPVITLVNPNSGQQGQTNLNVAVTGLYTNFVQGSTGASFGAGITVNSVTVNSATSLTANVSIAAGAATGARNLTVTTGAEVVNLSNAFTVTAGTPVITLVNPNSGQQGSVNMAVAVTGLYTNFVQGTTAVSFGSGITVSNVNVTGPTQLSAQVTIDSTAAIGNRTVTATTGAEVVNLSNAFTVTAGTPVITLVNPNSGPQGSVNMAVTVTGQYTNFAQGTTVVSFGSGITVSNVNVTGPTQLSAQLTIDSLAAIGNRTVTATTGAEVVTLLNGFSVSAGNPVITLVAPASAQQGASSLSVAVTGQNTHWVQGTTTVSFGAGVNVTNVNVTGPTSLNALISVDSTAATGSRTVTATTGGEVVSLANGFAIVAGTPVLLSAAPNSGVQGQVNAAVTLTGEFTHWVQGTTTVSFGAGITVSNVNVTSPTVLAAQITIDAAAALGFRTISVTTGAEIVNLTNGFSVGAGVPVISQLNPNTAQQGETNLNVAVTGQFTSFL